MRHASSRVKRLWALNQNVVIVALKNSEISLPPVCVDIQSMTRGITVRLTIGNKGQSVGLSRNSGIFLRPSTLACRERRISPERSERTTYIRGNPRIPAIRYGPAPLRNVRNITNYRYPCVIVAIIILPGLQLTSSMPFIEKAVRWCIPLSLAITERVCTRGSTRS